jgi:hypothetical protein
MGLERAIPFSGVKGLMGEDRRSPLNLNSLLAAVEAAPPVAAVDVLAGALAEAIGAREVSFLIADFSGRSLIRLGHSGGTGALRLQGKETAERVPLVGTPHGRLAAPAVEVIAEDRGARLFAPVTSRARRSAFWSSAWMTFRLSRRWPMSPWRRISWPTW